MNLATLRFATERLARGDADLAGIVRELGPPPFWGRRPGFATLVRIILEQQVSLASARSMFERLTGAVGPVTPETVGALGASGLRRLGFTGQKAAYCSGLADAIRRGALDLGVIAYLAESHAPSASFAVIRGSDTLAYGAYGLANVDAWRTPTAATIYEIGSITCWISRRRPHAKSGNAGGEHGASQPQRSLHQTP